MKDKPWFAVVYMFVVTAFFSSLVIGVARFTQDRVEGNQQLAFEKSVLEAIGHDVEMSSKELHEKYAEFVKTGKDGGLLGLNHKGFFTNYALPFEGKGFWAPIKGVIGINKNRKTIMGISFYEQNETPGLGGRIMEEEFREQFVGKVLGDGEKVIEFRPAGSALTNSQVHSITGATQTCSRLEKLMNEDIAAWLDDQGDADEAE